MGQMESCNCDCGTESAAPEFAATQRQLAISSSGKLRSCGAEKPKPRCQLSCSPAGPSGRDCDCGSKEQLLMMLLLLAAPKHVLPVMAMHLLKALCVRAVDPSYSSQLRPWNTPRWSARSLA